MSDLRTAAQQALEFIRSMNEHGWLLADYESDMERTVAGLEAALAQEQDKPICKCDLRTRLVGDGCEVCNPELAAESAQKQAEPVQEPVAAERERWALLLRAAGRVLQAFDDGYLQPDLETLQGGIAVDALRKAWGAFAPARIQGPNRMAEPDHETRAELAEQQVVQLAEERDHYRNLWQKAQKQAEPVQEPVAWIDALKDAFFEGFTSVATYNDTLLNSPEEAWGNYKLPHTNPPQRPRLTDEEIDRIDQSIPRDTELRTGKRLFARAVERAHGIGDSNG